MPPFSFKSDPAGNIWRERRPYGRLGKRDKRAKARAGGCGGPLPSWLIRKPFKSMWERWRKPCDRPSPKIHGGLADVVQAVEMT